MLKLSIGLTQGTGEADSPSCAASAILEVEVDPDLIDQPDRLREHAHRLFRLARESLGQAPNLNRPPDARRPAPRVGQHNGRRRSRRGRRASRAQILALHDLASRCGVDLDGLLRDRFRVCQLFELSASEAGELISELQANGTPTVGSVDGGGD
jgi:hypothetical protein